VKILAQIITSLAAAKHLTFQGIQLHKKDRKADIPICPNAFYENLKNGR
jgi:hypothetical protein